MSAPSIDLEELSARIHRLEATVRNLRNWVVIVGVVGVVFGYALKMTWDGIADAKARADEAREAANRVVADFRNAKAVATAEIKQDATALLWDFKAIFEKWVAEAEAPLVPHGIALAFTNDGPIPKGWALCDGQGIRPNLDRAIPLGTLDSKKLGVVADGGDYPVRASEVQRLSTDQHQLSRSSSASLYRVRFICR